MTTAEDGAAPLDEAQMQRLTENLSRVEGLSRRLVEVMSAKTHHHPGLDAPDQQLFTRAATAWWSEMMQNPAQIWEKQIEYWSESVRHFAELQRALVSGQLAMPDEAAAGDNDDPSDRRFSNPLWDTHPYFNMIKRQYLTNARAIQEAVEQIEELDPTDRRRLGYFADQIIDMMAPTNFLATNPDALERAVATDGESLISGLENLVADLEANDGELVVRLADESAFELGGNVATSPGDVVFRNHMMELIQYKPATETVHETPLLIFPPWINKFYILDLKAQNSLIRWITEQGHTLFVVSWINPDASYGDVGLENYIEDGYLTALREVKAICDVDRVNVIGYCIGGTTLALTLSLLKQRGDTSIRSATFFTTLTDFTEHGEFTPFLTNDFVDAIEAESEKRGILRSYILSRTFSFLRSRDLIYTPAVRSYMLGETPPAFDLLYWNGDGTNLPGRMAVQYLRALCQRNEFARDGYDLLGHRLHVSDVDVPLCAVACESDHIAAWKDSYRGVQMMGAKDKTFIVSQSGHIAGIVNPPTKKKYGHYTKADLTPAADDWFKAARFYNGSWWPRWGKWLAKHAGRQIPARETGDSKHPRLAPAPGTYVRVRASS
ncbi:class I poly(R)-hydroxyalkanoic acid synthase [Pontibaca methylaminivorans]|uniref:Polyhydroxyalkanoate synthase n=1 Tax=Pontibaca methylaminivorans TaxID=515897 RepID=A0A1R3WVF0_9RHOB|nr:class I poly(R)-hydroxyalkanoic acid synthase [Pontibaca methylaminivorans]SIT82350.1 polyhydroxyalkanoate synthase [Pontibaca methylaminivorans]